MATGKYDVVITHEVSLWDIAAGIVLLIGEAGGFVMYKVLENNKYDLIATVSFKLLNQVPFEKMILIITVSPLLIKLVNFYPISKIEILN